MCGGEAARGGGKEGVALPRLESGKGSREGSSLSPGRCSRFCGARASHVTGLRQVDGTAEGQELAGGQGELGLNFPCRVRMS